MSAIYPDLSIVVVMILVWSLYFVLKKSFFDPINQILLQRDSEIAGAQQEAKDKLAQADQKSRAYQDALKAARLESYRQQETLRAEASKHRFETLAETRHQAGKIVQAAKEEIEGQVVTAKRTLESEVHSIADGIVKTILR
jgi:F0F1-type ATP synthase membrane subunit b/b'